MRVVWSLEAHDQLLQAADFIESKFGEKSKTEFLDDIHHVVSLLGGFPCLGKEELLLKGPSVVYRSLVIGQLNKPIYHLNSDTIEIAALWDTRREPKALTDEVTEGDE